MNKTHWKQPALRLGAASLAVTLAAGLLVSPALSLIHI